MKRIPTLLKLSSALTITLLLALGGCGKGRSSDDAPVSVPAPARHAGDAGPGMRVVVSEVEADPTLDAQAVRSTLRDAEMRLVGCLDAAPASGLVAFKFAVEHDGSVGSLTPGAKTTFADERARRCMEEILGGLRYSGSAASRPEVAVVLEVRPMRAIE